MANVARRAQNLRHIHRQLRRTENIRQRNFIRSDPRNRSEAVAPPHDKVAKSSISSDQIQRELEQTAGTLPIVDRLAELFVKRSMFNSMAAFESAGFKLIAHAEHKIMSGSHRDARGYLFKKYNNDKPAKKQIKNYMRRIEGARLLRNFIEERRFEHVVAPRKWLYELPEQFPARYLVVADKLDLLADDATQRAYHRIDREQLRELATVLFYFRGLNSWTKNLPFTKDGKIAFIDTERWPNDKDYLRKIGDNLPKDRYDQARDIFKQLRGQGQRPFRSQFR